MDSTNHAILDCVKLIGEGKRWTGGLVARSFGVLPAPALRVLLSSLATAACGCASRLGLPLRLRQPRGALSVHIAHRFGRRQRRQQRRSRCANFSIPLVYSVHRFGRRLWRALPGWQLAFVTSWPLFVTCSLFAVSCYIDPASLPLAACSRSR